MPDTFNANTTPVAPITDFTLVAEVGDAPANTSTPYSMAVGDIFQGTIGAAGDNDFVGITLTAGVTYTISLTGQGLTNGLSDPYLEIYAANGTTQLAFNDDGGGGTNSLITFTPTTTGTYYIDARAFGTNTGDYALTVNEPNTNASFETLVEYLTDGYWEDTSRNTHAFDTSVSNVITVDITGLTAEGQQLARWAFEAWENVANIDFVEIGGGAQITFTDDGAGLGAGAGYVSSGTTTISSTINITLGWLTTFGTTIGSYGLQTYIHEIGHALGLGHQGNYNNSATYGVDNDFRNDTWSNSIMSYFDQTDNTTDPASYARLVGAGMIDIAAIQNLYGASAGGNSVGNSTWGYNSNVGGYMGTLFASMLDGPANASVSGTPVSITIHDIGGIDTLDFSGETVGVLLSLIAESWSTIESFRGTGGSPMNNLTISRGTVIENAIGGSGNDEITGNAANNTLEGRGGDDTLLGGNGADRLLGNSGSDSLEGGNGADKLFGGQQSDTLEGGNGNDRLFGENGSDELFGGAGNDFLNGGASSDMLSGGIGNDTLRGDDQGDTLYGNSGDDTLKGDAGNDKLFGGNDNDVLIGGTGIDRLFGESGNDTLFGEAGADLLNGGQGNDTLSGGQGNDTLIGGLGDDVLNGGGGSDQFVFTNGFGDDTLNGFDANDNAEKIDLSGVSSIVNFADLLANHMSQVGADVVIDDLAGNTITLVNVNIGDLGGLDFVF